MSDPDYIVIDWPVIELDHSTTTLTATFEEFEQGVAKLQVGDEEPYYIRIFEED